MALLIVGLGVYTGGLAQNNHNEKEYGFQKEKLFTGGSFTFGFSNLSTRLGVAPQLGYSLTNWADAGINFNFNYLSRRDYFGGGDKLRQTIYGPGVFMRLFPVRMIFATATYEYNFINYKYIPASGSTFDPELNNEQVGSLLLGAGYAGGRQKGNNTYYFFSISWDVLADEASPYVDGYGRLNPVVRAGFNIGLFQGDR